MNNVKLKTTLGSIFILAGIAMLIFGLPDFPSHRLSYEKLDELKAGQGSTPDIPGAFPIEALSHYRIGRESSVLELTVAHYHTAENQTASAIIFPPATRQGEANLRHDLWQASAEAIQKHTDKDALFISWWDNSQRVRFLTGRKPWLDKPIAAAFPKAEQQQFWQQASGGFDPDETRLKQLARWLAMDADTALAEMDQVLPRGQPVYWLLCLDDLARLGEIETLSGVKLPFEARIFPAVENIHGQIAEVQRWAGENGIGSYLVQQLPGGSARVWRITREDGVKTLLARLLPFTTSLAKPLEHQTLVYQSPWGGYLSVYQWQR